MPEDSGAAKKTPDTSPEAATAAEEPETQAPRVAGRALRRGLALGGFLAVVGAVFAVPISSATKIPLAAALASLTGFGALLGFVAAPLFAVEELARRRNPAIGRDVLVAIASFLILAVFWTLSFCEGVYASSVAMSGNVGHGTSELGELVGELAKTPLDALGGFFVAAIGIVPVSIARGRSLGVLKQLLALLALLLPLGALALVVALATGEAGSAGDLGLSVLFLGPLYVLVFKVLDVTVERLWSRFAPGR